MAYIRRPLLNMKHFSNVTLIAQERLAGDRFVWLAQLRLKHKFLTTSHQKSRSLIMANGYWWVAGKRKTLNSLPTGHF